jgi:hypothetical protein
MTSRWLSMVALILVAGLALAMAAPAVSTQPPATAPAALANATPVPVALASVAPATDPYVAGSSFTSEAPEPVTKCQIYAYQCVFEGGPCGPGGPNATCFCHNSPDLGWVCAR